MTDHILSSGETSAKPGAAGLPPNAPGVPMKKSGTAIYLVAFLCFAGAVGGLCYAGFSDNGAYFLNVSEASAKRPAQLVKARLFGTVSPQNLARDSGNLFFHLVDKDDLAKTIPVQYKGLVPDSFKAGAEVIVEGSMNALGQFVAKTLMTKCPSKYQKENRTF